MFGLSLLLLPLVGGGVILVCQSVVTADLFLDHFDANSPGSLLISRSLAIRLRDLPHLPSFRSSEVRRLLLDLHPYGGSDPLGMLPIFPQRTADVLASS